MATVKKILFINRRGPYGSIYAQEALEIALVGAAFDQQISLALIDDGVFLLRAGQDTGDLGTKPFTAAYRALDELDIHRVYVERESLTARGMREDELMSLGSGDGRQDFVTVLSSEALGDVIHRQDVLLNC